MLLTRRFEQKTITISIVEKCWLDTWKFRNFTEKKVCVEEKEMAKQLLYSNPTYHIQMKHCRAAKQSLIANGTLQEKTENFRKWRQKKTHHKVKDRTSKCSPNFYITRSLKKLGILEIVHEEKNCYKWRKFVWSFKLQVKIRSEEKYETRHSCTP